MSIEADLDKAFARFRPQAQVWVYIADRELSPADADKLQMYINAFADDWLSHGDAVEAGSAVVYGRILLLVGDTEQGVSGCGQDDGGRAVEAAARNGGFRWVSPLFVTFLDADGKLHSESRAEFKVRLRRTDSADYRIVDPSVRTVSELREGALVRPLATSWAAGLLPRDHFSEG